MRNSHLYVIRFDDMCPTMNWEIWDKIEEILDKHGVKPILAVIPDCQDVGLRYQPPNPKFWDRVREWQAKGYDIAMHGTNHVYMNNRTGIMGITRQSEFVGLKFEIQKNKIGRGCNIFRQYGIKSDIWIAPSHSFDLVTIKVLKEHGFKYISDGFGTEPFQWMGGVWVPCQLWDKISTQSKPGVYTVCNHHYSWTQSDLDAFEHEIVVRKKHITSFRKVINEYSGIRKGLPLAHIREACRWKLKNIVKTILKR